ncbi:hypothetical protein POSPLADRAFT_1138893 [Postia placenta MAD-698-R-SB12]|uniref:Uncharacterized protein n=1 Tax=Postia placenta MAD-698-R-SB12 TaxID=670580 RepID=A0A1X6N4Y4_9APHY|nr:hypothetical protein POSPLADRAFT_1138893 [Postia placenta MAD-698-R-SB12]OSX63668.1 hypothetical protein POSPLADRAFT_1138893 [Postia placenta MAD-698-R-SB12]
MNGLYILIPDTSHTLAAEHPPRHMSTPALSDDTGSSSSRESSRPATPTSGVSRAPSISFDDYSKHTHAGEGTDIRIVEADADSPLPEDITHPLKRRRLADTRADEVRAERALLPNIWSDAPRVDGGACFGLGHIRISDCTSVGDVEPDAVDPLLEFVSRPLKRKRSADTSTYGVRAKRARTSGTSSDAIKAEDRACSGLGHILIYDYTKIRVIEPEAAPAVSPDINSHASLEAITRPPKRKRCANTTVDEVCVKRRRLSDSPSDASQLKDGIPFGPHPRCMITGFVSAEVEACYILPPDTPQPLVYTYHVTVEDEQPPDSGTPQDHTIIPLATTAACSYRSLGWHELSANLHLMTIRVGREFMKRPLRYEHVFRMDALVHIPIVQLAQPDAAEPVSSHIERESPVEGIPRLPKRKRSPETEIDEVPVKRMRTSVTGCNASNIKDAVRFGPHPKCMITGCVSADVEGCYIWPLDMPQRLFDTLMAVRRDLRELWETNRLLMIPHPVHLKSLKKYCTAYKYCIIAEDEHPPDSCTTMGNPITPAVMAAPCLYRSLGWHKLKADLRLMVFRAGQKLSKRPFHYRHILRELLPHKEVNHTYTIFSRYASWTIPLYLERVRGRRLWATGELAPFPDGYFRCSTNEYCPPLSDDDTVRFPRPFRPIVSGIKRKRSGDTRADIGIYTAQEDAQCQVSVCKWRWDCDQARDEWTVGPPVEPEDAELLAYRQEEAGDMLPAAQEPWFEEWHSSKYALL